jgi:hypothetical protein
MEGGGGKEEERNRKLSKNENSARLAKSRAVFVLKICCATWKSFPRTNQVSKTATTNPIPTIAPMLPALE